MTIMCDGALRTGDNLTSGEADTHRCTYSTPEWLGVLRYSEHEQI
jgi:hypothetical protein